MPPLLPALLMLTIAELTPARVFVLLKWRERGQAIALDLSHLCKHGTLFMHAVFGSNFQQQLKR